MADENYQAPSGGYGKRPWWQWALLYIVIAGAVYAGIYFVFFSNKGSGYSYNAGNTTDTGISYGNQANPPADNSASATDNSATNQSNNTNQSTGTIIKSYTLQNMKVDVLKEGTGARAKAGDTVQVNYSGWLQDGTAFDSNVDPKFNHVQPFPLTLGQNSVIQGWELGVLGMKAGEKRKLTIPPELGYGAGGRPPVIPPNATLIFDVEVLKIN